MQKEDMKREARFTGKIDDLPLIRISGHGGTTKRIVFGPGRGWDDYVVRFITIAPGESSSAHAHDWPHYILITAGEARGLIMGQVRELSAGSWAHIPPNTEHFLENKSTEELNFFCIVPEKGDPSISVEDVTADRPQAVMKIIANPPASTVREMLLEANLPVSDITPEKLGSFYACESGGTVEGLVGLELLGRTGLLRSLVVCEKCRSNGLGSALVAHAESVARKNGIEELYLLTTTAEQFFSRLGYHKIPRETAPPEIRHTSEFSGICPASSAFMVKHLAFTELPKHKPTHKPQES